VIAAEENRTLITEWSLCLGRKSVIPPPGQESVLVELHDGHLSVSLAGGLVWWPNLDKEIENMVGQWSSCQQCQPSPSAAPMQP